MSLERWDMQPRNASVRLQKVQSFRFPIQANWGGCRWKAIYFRLERLFGNA